MAAIKAPTPISHYADETKSFRSSAWFDTPTPKVSHFTHQTTLRTGIDVTWHKHHFDRATLDDYPVQ